jgi:hypothetical protein
MAPIVGPAAREMAAESPAEKPAARNRVLLK